MDSEPPVDTLIPDKPAEKKPKKWLIPTVIIGGVLALMLIIVGILAGSGVFAPEPEPVVHQLNISRGTRLAFNAYANYLYTGEATTAPFNAELTASEANLQNIVELNNAEERQSYFSQADELLDKLDQAIYRDHPYEEDNPESPVYTLQELMTEMKQAMETLEKLALPTAPTDSEIIDFLRNSSVEVTITQIMRRYTDLSENEALYNSIQRYYQTYVILLDVYMQNGCVNELNEVDSACSYRVSGSSPSTLANYQGARTTYLLNRQNTVDAPLKLCAKINNLINE